MAKHEHSMHALVIGCLSDRDIGARWHAAYEGALAMAYSIARQVTRLV